MKDTSNPDITIKATGYQWKWGYDYLKGEGEGVKLISNLSTPRDQLDGREAKGDNYLLEVDQPMVVPVGKKIRILTTANDVIHAWWVPALASSRTRSPASSAIPGSGPTRRVSSEATAPSSAARITASCRSRCRGFGGEVRRVGGRAQGHAGRDGRRSQQGVDLAELKTRGEQVFAANCAACHQADGKGLPRPSLRWMAPPWFRVPKWPRSRPF